MTATVTLPGHGRITLPEPLPDAAGPASTSRIAYAAAHVAATDPSTVDWDATLAFRRHLWRLGLGVADAMDTAQRGMGLDWTTTAELIRRSAAEATGPLVCGAGTDHAEPTTLAEVVSAYEEQVALVEGAGAGVVLMASRALARLATGPADYLRVYGEILRQVRAPVILHWLGPMFDPALAGYWGGRPHDDQVVTTLAQDPMVEGVKVSLLDADREAGLRTAGVHVYTGDDFHYPQLIAGDGDRHSDALLGVFDPIAVAAAHALRALDAGDRDRYDALLAPTVPLARHCFAAPTRHYKTGVVFLAWLAGHQDTFTMLGGQQTGRDRDHLLELFRLAAAARVLPDPDLAVARMRDFLR